MTVPLAISGIDATIVHTPYSSTLEPAWSPGTIWRESAATIYRVHTDAGITGIGAARGNPDVVANVVGPLLTGVDPARIEPIVRSIINAAGGFAAIPVVAGIEMALWDLMGKAAGLPLYRLWGAHGSGVRAYASMVEVQTPERRAEDARRLLERGYTAIKLRLHDETMRQDIAQVEAVRDAVGDRM
ncbi:MAG TPA: enolase C-terminal domain-like protein, partial [Thermomicrobiales bacterium]|nr:enolase C-terminal domain-like protein [Thermomicrobiales bacterium]